MREFLCVDIGVSSADGKITVTEPVVLETFPRKVVWKLPEGYIFNYKGGGVFVASDDEISEAGGYSEDAGDIGQPTKRFKVKAKKLKNPPYKYTVIFDEMNGGKPTRRFTCDPTIANSHSLAKSGQKKETMKVNFTDTAFQCVVTDTP